MPTVEQDINSSVFSLAQSGSVFNAFTGSGETYIRMSVSTIDNNQLRQTYYSNKTWNDEKVYYVYQDLDTDGTIEANERLTYINPPQPEGLADVFYPESGTLVESKDIQLPIFWDQDQNWFVKPNDALSIDTSTVYPQTNYRLQFDFLQDIFSRDNGIFYETTGSSNPRLYIREVSTSRKEVRLIGRVSTYQNGELVNENAENRFDDAFKANFETRYGYGTPTDNPSNPYKLELSLILPDQKTNILVTNYEWDDTSYDTNSIILKLYNPLPNGIGNLSEVSLAQELLPTQFQDILYIIEDAPDEGIFRLTPDDNTYEMSSTQYGDNLKKQSYNELIESSSLSFNQRESILNDVFSASKYDYINLDFSKSKNHTFFGSAESKLNNFYSKIKTIEEKLTSISASINNSDGNFVTESAVSTIRRNLYEDVRKTISSFTPYEKWMYENTTISSSYPKIGINYAKVPAISGSFTGSNFVNVSSDARLYPDYYGMDLVYEVSTIGDDIVLSGSFNNSGSHTDPNDFWDTGSVYESGVGKDGGWYFSGSAAHFSGSGVGSHVYLNQTGSKVATNQFKINNTYKIDFDVISNTPAPGTGSIRFDFGDGASAIERVSFDITASGHYSSYHKTSQLMENPNNILSIVAVKDSNGKNFSGSIDNVSVKSTTDSDGKADIFTDQYRVEQYPMSHYNGPFYLSFLAKWPVFPTWENYNLNQASASFVDIPSSAWQGHYTHSNYSAPFGSSASGKTPAKNRFQRYILVASQSYWRTTSTNIDEGIVPDDASKEDGWQILSGQNITGSYNMNDQIGQYGNLLTYSSSAMLPSGELFRLYHTTSSIDGAESPITSSFITDVKIYKDDKLWNGNPTDVLDFSHLYKTGSNAVQNWYSASLKEARRYDSENIHALYNNIPKFYRDEDDQLVLMKFMSMLGEYYDILKYYIDNYVKINDRNYGDDNFLPNVLLENIGKQFGWEFLNTNSLTNLLEYHTGGKESVGISYDDLTNNIWKNILNNLIYIYKTKGTKQSINALLNCFGIPPNVVTVDTLGSSFERQVAASPGVLKTLPSGDAISEVSGNLVYHKENKSINHLWFPYGGSGYRTMYWNYSNKSGSALNRPGGDRGSNSGDTLRFTFTSVPTTTTQSLFVASGSLPAFNKTGGFKTYAPLWEVTLVPDTSYTWTNGVPVSASLEVNFNYSSGGSGSLPISSSKVTLSSTKMPMMSWNSDEVWSVELLRSNFDNSNELETPTTASYELYVAKAEGDRIKYWSHTELTSSDTTGGGKHWMNRNFISSGSSTVVGHPSLGNLYVGPNFTGSMSHIEIFSNKATDFNADIVQAGDSLLSARLKSDFIKYAFNPYYKGATYRLNELSSNNYNSIRMGIDFEGFPIHSYDFRDVNDKNRLVIDRNGSFPANHNQLMKSVKFNVDPAGNTPPIIKKINKEIYRFGVRGLDSLKIEDTIVVNSKNKIIGSQLLPDKSVLSIDNDPYKYSPLNTTILDASLSYAKKINTLITDYFDDDDLGQLLTIQPDIGRISNVYAGGTKFNYGSANPADHITPRYENEEKYPALEAFSNTFFEVVLSQENIIGINEWNHKQSLIPNLIWDMLERIIPTGMLLRSGIMISSHMFHRNKVTRYKSSGQQHNYYKTNKSISLGDELDVTGLITNTTVKIDEPISSTKEQQLDNTFYDIPQNSVGDLDISNDLNLDKTSLIDDTIVSVKSTSITKENELNLDVEAAQVNEGTPLDKLVQVLKEVNYDEIDFQSKINSTKISLLELDKEVGKFNSSFHTPIYQNLKQSEEFEDINVRHKLEVFNNSMIGYDDSTSEIELNQLNIKDNSYISDSILSDNSIETNILNIEKNDLSKLIPVDIPIADSILKPPNRLLTQNNITSLQDVNPLDMNIMQSDMIYSDGVKSDSDLILNDLQTSNDVVSIVESNKMTISNDIDITHSNSVTQDISTSFVKLENLNLNDQSFVTPSPSEDIGIDFSELSKWNALPTLKKHSEINIEESIKSGLHKPTVELPTKIDVEKFIDPAKLKNLQSIKNTISEIEIEKINQETNINLDTVTTVKSDISKLDAVKKISKDSEKTTVNKSIKSPELDKSTILNVDKKIKIDKASEYGKDAVAVESFIVKELKRITSAFDIFSTYEPPLVKENAGYGDNLFPISGSDSAGYQFGVPSILDSFYNNFGKPFEWDKFYSSEYPDYIIDSHPNSAYKAMGSSSASPYAPGEINHTFIGYTERYRGLPLSWKYIKVLAGGTATSAITLKNKHLWWERGYEKDYSDIRQWEPPLVDQRGNTIGFTLQYTTGSGNDSITGFGSGEMNYPDHHLWKSQCQLIRANQLAAGYLYEPSSMNQKTHKPYDPEGQVHPDNHSEYGKTAVYVWSKSGDNTISVTNKKTTTTEFRNKSNILPKKGKKKR
tara:strand:+ start:27586 stop:34794 length:7209 start_codon:yes stop_codon:yes gene_type:complete